MIFKGMKFSRCRAVVVLPGSQWEGASKDGNTPGNYMTFGKLISLKKTLAGRIPKSAVKVADTIWRDYDAGVWAIPIKCDGHSLTNMMYAENNTRLYLFQNGRVWTCKFRKVKPLSIGSASVTLNLSNGTLSATNGDGTTLHERKLYKDEWAELWDFIKRDKTQYIGRKNA